MENIEKSLEKFNGDMKFLKEFNEMMELIKKCPPKKFTSTPPFRPYEIQKLY